MRSMLMPIALLCALVVPAGAEPPLHLMLLRQDGAVAKADLADSIPPYTFSLLKQGLLPEVFPAEVQAVDLTVHEGGFYVLDRRGTIHSFGRSHGLEGFVLDQPVARALRFPGAGPEAVMVDDLGRGFHFMPGLPVSISVRSPTLGWAPIRDMELERGERILLDVHGGLYREDSPSPFLSFPLHRADDAEDLEIGPDGSYYVLTSRGLVYQSSPEGMSIAVLPTVYLAEGLARALVVTRDGGGFWILDAYGNLYAYGNAERVEPFLSPAPEWVAMAAVYPEDLRPGPQPEPRMAVSLLPASATLSTLQRRVELTVRVQGARDLAAFLMKLRYDPALLAPLTGEVVAGRDYARVGLEPVVRGFVWEASDELLLQGTAIVDEGKGISGRVEVARLPFRILAEHPVSTRVEVVWLKAGDSSQGSGWVEAAEVGASRLTLRHTSPRAFLSLSPDAEEKRGAARLAEPFPVYLLAQDWSDISGLQFDLDYTGARVMDLGYTEGALLVRGGREVRLDLDSATRVNRPRLEREAARPRQRIEFLRKDALPVGDGVLLAFYLKPLETGRVVIQLRNVSTTDSGQRQERASGASDQVVVDVVAGSPR